MTTQAKRAERLAYWQKALRLQDWDIDLRVCRRDEMEVGSDQIAAGSCDYRSLHRKAIIRLLEPGDYPKEAIRPQDQEETLVHELLHLYWAPFEVAEDSFQEIAMEQAINALAAALVKLDRRGAR